MDSSETVPETDSSNCGMVGQPQPRLRVCRSQRRCNGPGRLRRAHGTGATMPTVETSARPMVHGRMAHGGVVPVVASMVAVAGDFEAGEENGRDDEQDPGDDHDPRREPV